MYAWWEEKGYFKPGGDPKKKSYVVPMPPPNVTGYLHMGHAMGTTLQVRCLVLGDWGRGGKEKQKGEAGEIVRCGRRTIGSSSSSSSTCS